MQRATAPLPIGSELGAAAMAGDAGHGGPTPLASPRTSLSTLRAKAAIYPSQSTPDCSGAGSSTNCGAWNGPNSAGPLRRRSLLPRPCAAAVPAGRPECGFFPRLSDKRDGVHGEAERPSFLFGRQAAVLNGASLAVLLARHVLDVKRIFGYAKLRYRGLAKNTERLALLLGFSNLKRAQTLTDS